MATRNGTRLSDCVDLDFPVGHSLLEDGEESGAGGEEGHPLRYDDGEEEACVARVFQRLAVLVSPLLRRQI